MCRKGGEKMKLKDEIDKVPWNIKMMIARILLGLNQQEAADKIGTTQAMIWRWESGKSTPREASRKAIARAYKVNYSELFDGLLPKVST
jgi:ribosome-binding protein aMBF1 (putative translation factor)